MSSGGGIKMKKFVSIKGVIDNLRQSVNSPSPPGGSGGGAASQGPVRLEQDILESLVPDQFTAELTVRHGFPYKPLALAFDSVQKILAIGTRSGSVRLFGRPGIDVEFKHESRDCQVMQIEFLVNTGTLLTACTDDTVNLWDYKKKTPELIQSLKLAKERLTVMSVETQDKWIYLGTEKGNVFIMNLDSFALSGYTIDYNKLPDPRSKAFSHPGAVTHLTLNPADPSKLLIGSESGHICLWDLSIKKGEMRFRHPTGQKLYSISWHMDGRQFVCSHSDGSLVTWNVKVNPTAAAAGVTAPPPPASVVFPHGKRNKETNKMERCDPIVKVLWKSDRTNGDSYYVFSGGLPSDVTGVTPSITFMKGKSTTLLEMEYCVLDFLLVTDSPFASDYQEPEGIIAMLANDLVAIDVKTNGYPCFKNPYAMDFNDSPVTCCRYLVDIPGDLIPALYMVGSRGKKDDSARGFSSGEWPINGGTDGTETCSYTELVITGHADGSVRFWDASSTSMQSLYRIRTSKFFEKTKKGGIEGMEDDPYAITQVYMCTETRLLAVSGASSHVILFKFRKKETCTETKFMEIPIVYEVSNMAAATNKPDSGTSPSSKQQHFEFPPRPLLHVASQSSSYTEPVDGFNFDKPAYEYFSPLRLRPGAQKKLPGYHAELVCLTPWVNGEPPSQINCLSLNSNYGLMAYGNGSGLVIVDTVQNVCLLNMGTADLYGSIDPFQRMPKSPKPLDASPLQDLIQRVDLSNYSQVVQASEENKEKEVENNVEKKQDSIQVPSRDVRVKSPDCKRLQKTGSSAEDSSFSKSQSSSINSLDQVISAEGVCAVEFADSFATKNDFSLTACIYVGTSLGSVVIIVVNLPDRGDPRSTEPVVVSPSGTLFRIRGPVLTFGLLDCSTATLTIRAGEALENVRVPFRPGSVNSVEDNNKGLAPPSLNPGPTGDQQVVVFCTEKSAAVYALPSQRQMYSQTINESSSVVCAEVINFGGVRYTPCLVTYTADGFVKVYSVPSLRPMLDMYMVAMSSLRIGRTMCFSNYGHGLYLANATEVQKLSISTDFMRQFPEMTGTVYTDNVPMPEPPKQGFLKGLFGGGPKPLDREELFGETAGKPCVGVAKHIPGANMSAIQAKSAGGTSEVAKAHRAVCERGQKLNEVEERTEAMANEAKQYANNAHNLMNMYKNKRWYQL